MKFVILSHSKIPGYGVKGPVLSPATYDVHQVLKWLNVGIDVREVMEDGSFRKLTIRDERLLKELSNKIEKNKAERDEVKKQLEELRIKPDRRNNVSLLPEKKLPKKKVNKPEVVKEELKVEKDNKEEKPWVNVGQEKVDFIIDHLEEPE